MTKNIPPPMRLGRWHERWIYAVAVLLLASGIGWLVDHYFFAGSGDVESHGAFEPWWLRLHGAAAMAGLIVFGSLFPGHIARAWRSRLNRRSGLLMLGLVLVLVLSGYGLYYLGDEDTRPWISSVHWIAGIMTTAGMALHIRLGQRATRRRASVALLTPSLSPQEPGDPVPEPHDVRSSVSDVSTIG
jgi:hypothetical protein